MKYLKQITLKNFQSHKDSSIQFDRGLNAIIGPSDSGKSAIIRGIKWVLYNEPIGNYFIREGESETSVTLEFNDGIKIKRLRSKSKNVYILYNQDDEMIFEGFGNKIPQEIVDSIGITKIPLDSNESNAINLGEQLEGAFLLSEKGSIRASAIGRIIGVNIIDDALKETLKDIRNISIRKNAISENIKKTKKELTAYEYLDNLKKDLIKLENIRNTINIKLTTKDILNKILENYHDTIREKERTNKILSKVDIMNVLEKNIKNLEMKNTKLVSYKNINVVLIENKKQLTYCKNTLYKLNINDTLENKIPKIDCLIDKLQKFKKLEGQRNYYSYEIQQVSLVTENLKNLDLIKIKADTIQSKIEKLKKLKHIKNRIKLNNSSLSVGEAYIEKLKKIDLVDVLCNDLGVKINRKVLISNFFEMFYSYRIEIDNQNNILNNSKKIIEDKLKSYEKLLLKSEICPFCLSNINKEKIKHIIKHYN